MKDRKCPPHEPNGCECLVAHYDGPGGTLGPGCPECKHCGHFYRPHEAAKDCVRCLESDRMKLGVCPDCGGMTVDDPKRPGGRLCAGDCETAYGDGYMVRVYKSNEPKRAR